MIVRKLKNFLNDRCADNQEVYIYIPFEDRYVLVSDIRIDCDGDVVIDFID